MNKLSTQIIGMLVEGMSMRAITRAWNTVAKLLKHAADAAAAYLQ